MAQPSAPPSISNLALRVISAVVLLPLACAMAWQGGWVFAIFVAVLAAAMGWELAAMARTGPAPRTVSVLTTALAPLIFIYAGLQAAVICIAICAAIYAIAAARNLRREAPLLVIAAAYVSGAMVAVIWLRQAPGDGFAIVIWVLAIVVATDVGAYFAGRGVGGPKLAPRISPSKTWAGLIGGMICAAISSWIISWQAGGEGSVLVAGIGGLLAVVAQCGDLLESTVKRHFGVKDSGSLIPGHGGVLDRLDGFLTVAPVVALLMWGADRSPLTW